MRGRRARFGQVLAVVAHAGVILTLRDVVAAPLNYLRESLTSPITLAQFVGVLDEASPLARFFALFDVFVLWWIVVLAVGLAVLYQARVRAVAAGASPSYAGIAVAACRHHGRSRWKPLTGQRMTDTMTSPTAAPRLGLLARIDRRDLLTPGDLRGGRRSTDVVRRRWPLR